MECRWTIGVILLGWIACGHACTYPNRCVANNRECTKLAVIGIDQLMYSCGPTEVCCENGGAQMENLPLDSMDYVQNGEFPWTIALFRRGLFFGGGSLIAPGVVLTAAHLLLSKTSHEIVIRAGEWDMASVDEPQRHQEHRVVRTTSSPSAYLFKGRPLTRHTVWCPDGESVFLTTLKYPIVNRGDCQNMLRKTRLGARFQLASSLMCAGGEKDKDVCIGDGGSALVCSPDVIFARFQQVGIVAWGVGCGRPNVPSTYTNVSMFREWIDRNLKSNSVEPLRNCIPIHPRISSYQKRYKLF
ncbi:phenoloxidase-activating factor 2-like [Drosophila mauritiana]|uniref:Phenoloxidase-activating factor 2-like n=1 Tax=Drosophila mauritiana TaxID=7226 RepID=A0A6P8JJH4_DROMA|nr:phenoloxidase-activating factor 2-like [Drosophila mauritiana]